MRKDAANTASLTRRRLDKPQADAHKRQQHRERHLDAFGHGDKNADHHEQRGKAQNETDDVYFRRHLISGVSGRGVPGHFRTHISGAQIMACGRLACNVCVLKVSAEHLGEAGTPAIG
jgi:hypothetical protein